jgi:sulfite reductase (NADPH) flavoprotein alpha-component
MFYYFGYGSNINLISLRAKGVEPLYSARAHLKGWRLTFNVRHWFRHEGGMGNIEPGSNPGDYVEGMVHKCLDEHLPPLDAVEAYGVGYDRISVRVETEAGPVEAFAYVGLPAYIDDSCQPTRRYMNIILKGAEQAGLSEEYIRRLRAYRLKPEKHYPEFTPPESGGREFTRDTISGNTALTALGGAVFDMSGAREELQCLKGIFGGRDTTLFHLKRHDSSDGTETLADILDGSISEGGRQYLNAYLHEYAHEFEYVGRYVYTASDLSGK